MPPRTKSKLSRFSITGILSTLLAAFSMLIFAGSASAAESFQDACGGTNNFDYATCERLDFIASSEDDNQREFAWLIGIVTFGVTLPVWRGILVG